MEEGKLAQGSARRRRRRLSTCGHGEARADLGYPGDQPKWETRVHSLGRIRCFKGLHLRLPLVPEIRIVFIFNDTVIRITIHNILKKRKEKKKSQNYREFLDNSL